MCECTVDLRARGTSPSITAHCWICFMAAREAESGVSRVRHSPGLEVDFSDLIMIDCWYDFTTHYWPAAHLLLLSIIWLRFLLAEETEQCRFPLCLQTGWFYQLNVQVYERYMKTGVRCWGSFAVALLLFPQAVTCSEALHVAVTATFPWVNTG